MKDKQEPKGLRMEGKVFQGDGARSSEMFPTRAGMADEELERQVLCRPGNAGLCVGRLRTGK